ncbi:MAG: hypothetical protein ACPLRU_02450 [Desulfofundulus sp.]|uniref:hypothetical protein n=1 Tax=Desulfofundulus sp. TaxID=2282750 RepID=UPI003C739876
MKEFLLSEKGGIVEWLVGALIIGIGSIPIIAGITNALLQVSGRGEERIRDIIWTGY